MWGSATEQYRNGCEGFKHQQSGKRMKTTSIKEHSLFERELEREKVLRKQWGRGNSSLKEERKDSTLKRSTAGRREGVSLLSLRETFCDLELNLQTMMTSTQHKRVKLTTYRVEDEITTLIVFVMVWVPLSVWAQNMRLFLLLLLFLSSRNGSATPILNPYKSRVNIKSIFKLLAFTPIWTNPLHQAAVQTVQGPPFYEQVKLYPIHWFIAKTGKAVSNALIRCKKYMDYVNLEITNNLKIYDEIEYCFDISVPYLRRIFSKQT